MRIFRKISYSSVTDAKNRLKSVLKNDRISVSGDRTIEKMKKEVSTVLAKYAKKTSM